MADPFPINTAQTLVLAKQFTREYVDGTLVGGTAGATVTAEQQAQGVVLHNTGASGAITFVTQIPVVGDKLTAVVRANQNLIIDLPTGAIIDGVATTGQNYAADAIGEFLVLICVVAGAWSRVSTGGTWTAS